MTKTKKRKKTNMRSKNRDGDIRVIGKHTLVTAKGCPNCTTIDGVVYNCGCQ